MTNRRELADKLETMTFHGYCDSENRVLTEAARLLREPVAGEVEAEAIKHLRAMSHVAPRSFEVEAAFDFIARHDAILRARLDDEGKGE